MDQEILINVRSSIDVNNINNFINTLIEIQETGQGLIPKEEIIKASKSNFVLVRTLVAEILMYYPQNFAFPILLQMLSDKNPTVRSSATIGISKCNKPAAYFALKKAFLTDTNHIVRAYAGCYFISNDNFKITLIPWIENILIHERNYLVRVMCYGELYKKEPTSYFLKKIIKCFDSKTYQTRCAVLNVLNDVLNNSNSQYILQATYGMLKKEKLDIIRESITSLQKKAAITQGTVPPC